MIVPDCLPAPPEVAPRTTGVSAWDGGMGLDGLRSRDGTVR
jgi:hypothetical protein